MNEDFNVDDFIAGLKEDKSKERTPGNYLVKVMMNQRDHQGTITFVPFISKGIGNIYKKIEGVREWYGGTSLIDNGEAWYRILPIQFYKGITPEQTELYNEVISLFDSCDATGKYGWDKKKILRVRNYSLFTGVCLKHRNTDNKDLTDNTDKACLFIFPSNSPIDALETCISSKAEILGPKITEFIRMIITPSLKKQGVIQISFKKANGPGYDSSVSFEVNNGFTDVIDPNKEFTEDLAHLFDDPIQTFLGWLYDHDKGSYFNETAFVELRNSLQAALLPDTPPSENDDKKPENKNSQVDPMSPPIPGVEQTPNENFKAPF